MVRSALMRWLAVRLLALTLPVPVAAWASVRLADHGAHVAATALHRVLAPLTRSAPAAPEETAPPASPFVDVQAVVVSEHAPGVPRYARRASRITHGIRVSAARVLQLANAGVRPSGRYVPSDGVRPPGLALSGVAALGIGMRDGDVLVNAGGRAATSASAVVGAVIGARAAHARSIDGVFWRDGEPWQIIVDQPYLSRHGGS